MDEVAQTFVQWEDPQEYNISKSSSQNWTLFRDAMPWPIHGLYHYVVCMEYLFPEAAEQRAESVYVNLTH